MTRRIAHCAINDVHSLAAKYDGSITEKEAEIKGVLISMCIDSSRHLDAVHQLLMLHGRTIGFDFLGLM